MKNERGYLKVRPCVFEYSETYPETNSKVRDKPFGGKVLEIDCLMPENLFFPWRSYWFPPGAI